MASATASEPATRADLDVLRDEFRKDMAAHRAESREDMAAYRAESREDINTLAARFDEGLSEVRADLRTWVAATIGLTAAVAVGTIGAIVTIALVG